MITQEELKELLHYNARTGIFTWVGGGAYNSKMIGKVAGTINGNGYIGIKIQQTLYQSHRLAWLYVYGEFPADQIDHINHIRTDNSIENLREATNSDNQRNTSLRIDNSSGVVGVSWHRTKQSWQASIAANGKRDIYLGSFAFFNDAVIARKMAEYMYDFHENHGRRL